MNLIKYNAAYELPAFGLNNMGATCYFNAMLQSLLSCTAFAETIIQHKGDIKYENHPITKTLMEIIEYARDPLKSQLDVFNNLKGSSPILWRLMARYLCKKNKVPIREFMTGQQCAREGYHCLLDSLGKFPKIQKLFLHRYKSMILCAECENWVSTKECPYNIFEVQPDLKTEQLDIFRTPMKKEQGNKSIVKTRVCETPMNDFLEKQKSYVTEFRCPKCKDTKEKYNINILVMVPEILVVLSKKYVAGRKLNINTEFPETMVFNKESDNPMRYSAVSQIEHSGNLNGGHYWAICKRKDGWYTLNDTSVSPGAFKPTVNTYIVFYQLL
jgi:ubiquitin C-terminal hydrolase